MSINTETGGRGGGLVIATTSTAAGVALPQTGLLPETGILPQTGSSDLGIMVVTAIATFMVMVLSHGILRSIRAYRLRRA